jgi:hypothetical protein
VRGSRARRSPGASADPVLRSLHALLTLVLVFALAACGRGGEDAGGRAGAAGHGPTATLWVTHDRGATVVVDAAVPAGLNAIEALKQHAEVETRYGGRFVQAIDGAEGSLERRQDWFYFVNGIEADLGGAEVTVRAGDVVWWDLRSWREEMRQPVVVGAFPEPFLHGWNGRRRPAEVRAPAELAAVAEPLLAVLGGAGGGEGEPNVLVLEVDPDADGATLAATRGPRNDSPVTFTLRGSEAAVRAAAEALASDPDVVRFRYDARFDAEGKVVP